MRKKKSSKQAKLVECLLSRQMKLLMVVLSSFSGSSKNCQHLQNFRNPSIPCFLHCCFENLIPYMVKNPSSSFCQPAAI